MKRYRMREQWLSIGDDFWIEDDAGQKAFKVDGKALRLRKTLVLEGPTGEGLCKIQERRLPIRDSMEIERPDGERLALVQKALISPLRDRFVVKIPDAPDLEVRGSILDHEYEIEREGKEVAKVSKRWFSVRDTYGVEIAPGQDEIVILAVAVAIDVMAHEQA